MRDYALVIDRLSSMTDVLTYIGEVCVEEGVVRMSYHFSPIFDEPVSLRTIIYTHGFSEQWLRKYELAAFRKDDPIPARTFANGAFLEWESAMENWPNSPEQERYFDAMKDEGLMHGFGVPLYGPRGREAYSSFDFGRPVADVEPGKVSFVRALAQTGHVRISHLIDEDLQPQTLSSRETEVLTWMARGKTAQDIGVILSLSPETIRTYIKRLYEKMGTNDRIGAVVRGLKLGLIRI